MQRYSVSLALLACGLLLASCGDMKTPAQPSTFGSGSSVSLSLASPTAAAIPVRDPVCPRVPPFNVRFNVIVRVDGGVNVAVTDITMRFTDSFGVGMPLVTLAAPIPTTQFGTALVQARSSQTIPLALGVGCGTARTGRILVTIGTRDDTGRSGSGQVVVTVN